MKKWAENFIEKQKSRSEKINVMISNTLYVEWLNQFTQDKEGFSDEQWLYFSEKISSIDRENVEMLNLFYEGIDKYAKQNHIYPTPCGSGKKYKQCCGK